MRLRTLTGTALLALVLAAAGCSSDSKNTGTVPPPANGGGNGNNNNNPAATLPACPTSAALSAALGVPFGDLTENSKAKERDCSYGATSIETGPASVVFQILDGTGDFAAVKIGFSAGRQVSAISGVGDEAFSGTLTAGSRTKATVGARKGLLMALVDSYAPVDKEQAFIATFVS